MKTHRYEIAYRAVSSILIERPEGRMVLDPEELTDEELFQAAFDIADRISRPDDVRHVGDWCPACGTDPDAIC